MKTAKRLFLVLCLSGTALALPARADEVPPAVQAMLDSMERQSSIKPSYQSLETDGSGNVTITNLSLNKPAANGAPAINTVVGKIVIEGIADQGDGLYEIGTATFSGFKADLGGEGFAMTVEMPEGKAEGLYVKAVGDNPGPEEKFRAAMNVARHMSSGKATITAMGQTFTVDGYETTWDGDPKTGAGKFSMKVMNIAVPDSALTMADQTGMLKQLGYSSLNFDVTSDGEMTVEGGNFGLDFTVGLAGKDIGTLKIAAKAADVPVAVYAEVQSAQRAGKEPDFAALMPQLQAITFHSASLRFEDSSLVKRLLPMLAQMQGMDEAALVANAGAMMQVGLMQLQNQAFSDQVVGAVNSFLKDPKSITIGVKPASPLKVEELMMLNPATPGEAIGKLGVTVTAND